MTASNGQDTRHASDVPISSINGKTKSGSAVLSRDLRLDFPRIVGSEGLYIQLHDGRRVLDASGGAAVACIGHGDVRVHKAMMAQLSQVSYCATTFYSTESYEKLCAELVSTTKGHMSRAYIVNSGSEAMEAAMKLARQYFLEKSTPEPQRTRFIARKSSYHGTTLGALSLGGHAGRRAKFKPMLLEGTSRVSPCFSYRLQDAGESDEAYSTRLAEELDAEFRRVGPESVCAFVAEPVVGAALGCVPSVPGYFKAVRAICDKYGALLILDEVMCGMGRTGTMHAWEQEGVVPDIQTLGKCLGGGYQPIAGVLASSKVVQALEQGTGIFVHGHTYQGHPVACSAALEVLRIIQTENLVANVAAMGKLLSQQLHERLASHPNVGDIRGRGLFWGIELVADKGTKAPLPLASATAFALSERGLLKPYSIAVYPGSGTVDGFQGDHIIVSPPYNISAEAIVVIAETLQRLIEDFFSSK